MRKDLVGVFVALAVAVSVLSTDAQPVANSQLPVTPPLGSKCQVSFASSGVTEYSELVGMDANWVVVGSDRGNQTWIPRESIQTLLIHTGRTEE